MKKTTTADPQASKPRTIDPAIAELRAKHKFAVAELHKTRNSAAILKRITEELLHKMTLDDKAELRNALE